MRWVIVTWLACALLGACRDEPAPWEGDAGRREDWQMRRIDVARAAAPSASSSASAASTSRASLPNRGDPCDAGFRAGGEPRADVVRLGTICGPPERFRRERDAIEGVVAEGGATVEIPLRMEPHRCYRVVAAAEASVADLDVDLRSERDIVLASDDDDAPFVVVHRRGAVCSERAEDARAVFRAGTGRGRFAAEIWSRPDEETPIPATSIDGRGTED